jgi:small ligand-binding sensory domain FIST
VATLTLGTAATTTLVAVKWTASSQVLLPADMATINNTILDDLNVAHPQASLIGTGGFSYNGQLFIPNRGWLKVLPGDYVGVDPNGWPILVSANSIAGSGWSHS